MSGAVGSPGGGRIGGGRIGGGRGDTHAPHWRLLKNYLFLSNPRSHLSEKLSFLSALVTLPILLLLYNTSVTVRSYVIPILTYLLAPEPFGAYSLLFSSRPRLSSALPLRPAPSGMEAATHYPAHFMPPRYLFSSPRSRQKGLRVETRQNIFLLGNCRRTKQFDNLKTTFTLPPKAKLSVRQ